jgi:serine kinase of HPr protein (carbohydrate metabolism regulator)
VTSVHATCVAIEGLGVLLIGPSGTGKSDLALQLIDRGAALVSDDYVELSTDAQQLWAAPPPRIAGKIEIRGLGIVDLPHLAQVRVALVVDLAIAPDRFPLEPLTTEYLGISLALVRLDAHEASAPIKVEYAAKHLSQ